MPIVLTPRNKHSLDLRLNLSLNMPFPTSEDCIVCGCIIILFISASWVLWLQFWATVADLCFPSWWEMTLKCTAIIRSDRKQFCKAKWARWLETQQYHQCVLIPNRNPDGDVSPWCYVAEHEDGVYWKYCDIPACQSKADTPSDGLGLSIKLRTEATAQVNSCCWVSVVSAKRGIMG